MSPIRSLMLLAACLSVPSLAFAQDTAAEPAAAKPAAHAAHRHHVAKHAHKADRAGNRITDALNSLSADGYTDIKDIKASRNDVTATATKDGKETQVKVSPDGKILPGA